MKMGQFLIVPGSREAVKEISLKLLPSLAQSEAQVRISSVYIDPVLDMLAADEVPIIPKGSREGGASGQVDLIALVLVPAVTSAVAAVLTQIGVTTAATFWQKRTRKMEAVFRAEVKEMIKKVNPNLSDREINRLAEKVVRVVWDYLSTREQVVNTLLEEMSEGLTQTELAELRAKIDRHFNESELKSLCFDIGINYEQFSTETKQDKVREVLAYCLRYKRVSYLRTACRRARPNVSW